MGNTSTQKILVVAVICLLLLNLGILAFLFTRPGPPPFGGPGAGPEGPARVMEERLGMDEKQKAAFAELREAHQALMRGQQEKLGKVREALFDEVAQNGYSPAADSLSREMGRLQAEMVSGFAQHFGQLREILTEGQRAKLSGVLKELPFLRGEGGRGPHGPR